LRPPLLPPDELPAPELPDDRPPELPVLLDDDRPPELLELPEEEATPEPPEDDVEVPLPLPLRLPEDEDERLNGPPLSPPPSVSEPVWPESPHAKRTAMQTADVAHTLRLFMLVSSIASSHD
jgi:hypothetical protein